MAKNTNKIVCVAKTLAAICLPLLFQWEAAARDSQPDEITVSTEYTYHVPSSVTENEAKATALTRAKIKAIEEHFGTVVSQNNATSIKANGEKSDVKFTSISQSEITGEWIETIGEPTYDIQYDGGLVITVRVKGIIRPIINAECDIDAHVYCNGVGSRFERNDFKNGDDLFVSVSSPIDGYIAVYLSDGENVFCLLPYPDDDGHATPITGGDTKILFSYDHPDPKASVRQYHLTSDKDYELNMLYLIFSQNQFDKASDKHTDRMIPRQLTVEQFHKWLSSCKRHDRKFQLKEFALTITQ